MWGCQCEDELSSVDEHTEFFNEDENCNGIVAELNPNHEGRWQRKQKWRYK